MAYESITLETDIRIEQIYTVHYFEYRSDFHFSGERHNFWEFQYVDKGKAEVTTDSGPHYLNRGQVIFHKPNEFHTMTADESAPNIAVVSFVCHSPAMGFFENQILTLSDSERSLLGQLIAETRRCIATPLDDPYLQKMEPRKDAMFGAQQMIRLYLEQILISLIRRYTIPQLSVIVPDTDSQAPSETYSKILFYLEEHIRESVTVQQI